MFCFVLFFVGGGEFVGIKRKRKKSIHDAYLKDGSTCVKEFGMTILDQKVNLILNPYDPTKSFLWSLKKSFLVS